MLFDICHNVLQLRESKSHIAVRRAVINRNLSALGIMDGSAGEAYVRNESPFLIPFFRGQKEILAPVFYDGRIVDIADCPADGLYITVAGPAHAMVKQKPSFRCFNGSCAAADF